MAAQNGHESVVRLLMNSTGVQVDAATKVHVSYLIIVSSVLAQPLNFYRVLFQCTWQLKEDTCWLLVF